MRIVEGQRFYSKEIEAATRIDKDGWDRNDGRNRQWYSLYYNPNCGLTILRADNSGDWDGDYEDRFFATPKSFADWAKQEGRDISELLRDIDENNEYVMHFVNALINKKNVANE